MQVGTSETWEGSQYAPSVSCQWSIHCVQCSHPLFGPTMQSMSIEDTISGGWCGNGKTLDGCFVVECALVHSAVTCVQHQYAQWRWVMS